MDKKTWTGLSVSDDTITLHYEGEATNPNHDDTSLFDEHIIGPSTSKDIKDDTVQVKVCPAPRFLDTFEGQNFLKYHADKGILRISPFFQ